MSSVHQFKGIHRKWEQENETMEFKLVKRKERYRNDVEAYLAKTYSDTFIDELMQKYYESTIKTWDYELNAEHLALEILRLYEISKYNLSFIGKESNR